MNRSRRVVAAALAFGVVVILVTIVAGARGTRAQEDPASRAILYLQAQQSAKDGSIPGGYSLSELYAIAAAAGGYDPNALTHGGPSVVDYLRSHAGVACAPASSSAPSAGACGELIQAVVAAGGHPRAFGGHDLVATLTGYFNQHVPGAYGDGEAFTQALAIQGLVAAAATVPRAALAFLEGAQDSDGGWDYLDKTNDPSGSDTNSTAMALMALDAAGDHGRDAPGLAWLATQQDPDGGFPYQKAPGVPSDPDSTALVLQAIVATGGDPQTVAWTAGGSTAVDYLIRAQDGPSGGYTFPGNSGPDAFTTAQVPPALLLQPYPAAGVYATHFTMASETLATLNSLLYLQAQQSAKDGGIPGGYSLSELYAIAAAAGGYDPNALTHGGPSVVDYLRSHAGVACAPASSSAPSAGACGELIQAVVAAGGHPRAFGGHDLVATLTGYFNQHVPGAYGDGEAFTQALAIQGLVAAAATVPRAALAFLEGAQDSDGGWDYLDKSNDPSGSDTNSTAMALMALDAAGDHGRDAPGLAWLATQQDPDGGFPYQKAPGVPSDPDSTALVLQAIVAGGLDPAATALAPSGHSPIEHLITAQAQSGGYVFPGNAAPDAFTTTQVPFALERVPFPVPFGSRAWYKPGATLTGRAHQPGPTPSPSPSPVVAGLVTPPAPSHSPAGQASNAAPVPSARVSAATAPSNLPSPAAATPAAAPPSRRTAGTALTAPLQSGLPPALLYALAAVGAAIVAGGAGVVLARR